ncbi:Heavy metal-associated isoprenylated plant protein [Thalictrum thalictroides]|uniref:Heavy metal-associated isoprenylated plant protein n=1 Tax=Thalictrum thalictroides TaxID=46969 RepID=A0A7J6WDS1_THATH|nr:Heavy metal-associated isoprenylated plant protein [Thalictrum thalictroides]
MRTFVFSGCALEVLKSFEEAVNSIENGKRKKDARKPQSSNAISVSILVVSMASHQICFINHQSISLRPGMATNICQMVELLVHMDCDGCQRRIRKAISKLDGVDSFDIDMDNQKVTVKGYVEHRKVLKVVRRTGRKAEFWPFPYDGVYHPYASQYLEDSTYSSTYNYYRHGYNESSFRGYFPDPAYSIIIDDHTAHLFNEDNVHACTIM